MTGPSSRVRGAGPVGGGHGRGDGTIPRVRGAAPQTDPASPASGTIPAGAGSSCCAATARPGRRDHPRGCGEQRSPISSAESCAGPSPRVRGAELDVRDDRRAVGTIPAGAGSRTGASRTRAGARDHPRGCGEQAWTSSVPSSIRGPSPRVRGAGLWAATQRPSLGTIPAGAGSSTRGRGRSAGRGTIPAGAGSRQRCQSAAQEVGDHPRGCGEQEPTGVDADSGAGPSPRVRGAADHQTDHARRPGTIPAGAVCIDLPSIRIRAARPGARPWATAR